MLTLIVHSPECVRRAPADARLITPLNFCCYAGVGYGVVLSAQSRESRIEKEEVDSRFTIHDSPSILFGCGDDAAVAHDALRMGLKHIYSACAAPMFAKLQAIARNVGAEITTDYPTGAIDMREWWARNGKV